MLRTSLLFIIIVLSSAPLAFAKAKAPGEVGGFALGANISAYKDRLDMNTAKPLPGAPYLMRVNVKPTSDFNSGYLIYGACASPGKIVRVKLRYADAGVYILTEINSSLTQAYGQPEAIRDNAERSYICNKWSLTNEDDQAVSVILQHYDGWDPDYDRGSSIKLGNWTLIDAERSCYEAAHPGAGKSDAENKTKPAATLIPE